ncbi:MAG: ABC transporter permease subunit [Planctomycetes bacterium]|nr:ABC transporter permease subunit [Planctomycetota bacterium]
MKIARFLEIARTEFRFQTRRPLFWVLLVVLGLMAWGFSTGNLRISAGDSDVGGKRVFITSQYALAFGLSVTVVLLYSFFLAVAAGMTVIRDEELKLGEVLHSTPLTPGEYVWGKFAGVSATFTLALGADLALRAFFNHALKTPASAEFVGPFSIWSYVRPALWIAVPTLLFLGGASFLLGAWTRKPILVFALPTILLLACIFFLWSWNPSWLSPSVDNLLMLLDPAGLRWLEHTWLQVDRGAEFYNTQPLGIDAAFAASRLALAGLGLASIGVASRRLARELRGAVRVRASSRKAELELPRPTRAPGTGSLAELRMSSRTRGLLAGVAEVARAELRELRHQPGLYLFVPLILLQTISISLVRVGAFDTPLLSTSGTLAVGGMNTLTLLLGLLLLFYTVESLERENARGLFSIYYATPVRTAAVLFGKALANSLVGVVILAAAWIACGIVLLVQGKVGMQLSPFLLVWGLCLLPTLVAWNSFVTLLYALGRNRYTTYALALGVLIFTGWMQARGHMNWVGNWNLWGALVWSDMGSFELGRGALVLNRLLYLSIAVACIALAVRVFPRRSFDAAQTLRRLQPRALALSTLRFSPFLIVPLGLGIALYSAVDDGFQGGRYEKLAKDYWRKNIATWKDAPKPAIVAAVVDLTLEPERGFLHTRGEYTLMNDTGRPLESFPVTKGAHYRNVHWTLGGAEYTPEDRAGLEIFTPEAPLAPGGTLQLGFELEGVFPEGSTKNGGGTENFVLPSGVVLTSFGPEFVPVVGYLDSVGVDADNKSDPKVWRRDWYEGVTKSGFGNNLPQTTKITIHAPEEYTLNSVGTLTSDTVEQGIRTSVWESDHPVNFFNVVAGKWTVKRGKGTAIYYHPGHEYNVDEMLACLDGARLHYSEWFYPYPWNELKLSEFPGLAGYAQGFPTNITFSESIGFLTNSDPKASAAFMVTAHESAHQWWGNILEPGEGPGGDILSEGMAHFSTILLTGEMRGERERIELCKRFEEKYGDGRQVDSEKPMVELDGSRPGDRVVLYEKGGMVAWMMLNQVGRANMLRGCQEFIRRFEKGPDHPVLQDFTPVIREYAPDQRAYDAFVEQWYHHVVVPEYKLEDVTRAPVSADGGWDVELTLRNTGTGTMPVEVCAFRGERFPDEPDSSKSRSTAPSDSNVVAAAEESAGAKGVPAAYRESRASVTLGAGESQKVVIHCEFEPQQVSVDPDALVLQLRRKLALFKF